MNKRMKRAAGKGLNAGPGLSKEQGGADLFRDPEEVLDYAREAIKGTSGVSCWELYMEQERSLDIEAREARVESMTSARTMGLAVRIMTGSAVGFSFTNDFSKKSVREAVERARDAAKHMPESPYREFPSLPEKGEIAKLDVCDPGLADIPEAEKVERAMLIEKSAMDHDPRIKRVRGAEYEEQWIRVWIENSSGGRISEEFTTVSASAEAVAEENGDAQAAQGFETAHHYDRLEAPAVGGEAAGKACALLGGRSMPAGRYPAVFSSEAACGLISVAAPAACGDSVLKKRSWLAGKTGKEVASSRVTLVDDALWEDGPAAFPFDDEGVASRRTAVINRGVLEAYLFDMYYGARQGDESSGNGVRPSYLMPPGVDTTNWVLLPGGMSEGDLIKSVEHGVYIFELMGLHTADPVTGEFSLGAAGMRIEKGSLSGAVTGIAVAGVMEELFKGVEEVSDTIKFYGGTGAPAVLVGVLDVSGTE